MNQKLRRIAVIGPESTGKSELCEKLADIYKTNYVREYAREYLTNLHRKYNHSDILEIYKTQYLQETEMIKSSNRFIFVDTEFIIAKVWSENSFQITTPYFEEMIESAPYDFYLLTAPDLPWEFDELRENPGKGDFFFKWYIQILDTHHLNYGIVSGIGDKRVENAIAIIESQNFFGN